MKVSVTILQLLVVLGSSTNAFLPSNTNNRQIVSTSTSTLYAETAVSDASTASSKPNVKTLGLLTFDLDDTLFPIAQCVKSANGMYLSLNVWEELNLRHLPYHDYAIKICYPGVNIICLQTLQFYRRNRPNNHFLKSLVVRNIVNTAGFVAAMERFGFEGVDAFDIVNTGKKVREELDAIDPEKAAGL